MAFQPPRIGVMAIEWVFPSTHNCILPCISEKERLLELVLGSWSLICPDIFLKTLSRILASGLGFRAGKWGVDAMFSMIAIPSTYKVSCGTCVMLLGVRVRSQII